MNAWSLMASSPMRVRSPRMEPPVRDELGSTARTLPVRGDAVEHGYAEAQYQLGRSYADNRGFVKGEAEAAKWFRKAAYQGHVRAQNRLGLCCQYGKGLEKNDVEATLWHQKAAEQGHSKAQYNLGDCYAKGNGIEKDKAEAVKWHLKAAGQGYAIDTQADGQKQ